LTVPEVRHLLTRLVLVVPHATDHILGWSDWRRRHQAVAKVCHYNRRLALVQQLQL
jgi:hypothetical protein